MYDTDLQFMQRGRAVTSMFRDITIEIYARFQSLLPLYYLWFNLEEETADTTHSCGHASWSYP